MTRRTLPASRRFFAGAPALAAGFAVIGFLVAAIALVLIPAAAAVELDDVFNVFDDGAHVFVEPGAENVDAIRLQAVVDRAAQADINLYIAVVANGSERVEAELLRDALGPSTVLVFTPDIYRLATSDMCEASFIAARQQSNAELSNGTADEAASAFVEAALLQPRCTASSGAPWLPLWLLIPLLLLALGLLGGFLFRSLRKSRDAERRAREFEERREVLREWAFSLREPLTALNGPVTQAGNPQLSRMYNDALSIAQQSESDIARATEAPELDAAEIRVARAQMEVRELSQSLEGPGKGPQILRP